MPQTNTTTKGELHIGSKLVKEDGKIVTVIKFGFAGKEPVYGLSDGTMVFADDIGKRITIKDSND